MDLWTKDGGKLVARIMILFREGVVLLWNGFGYRGSKDVTGRRLIWLLED